MANIKNRTIARRFKELQDNQWKSKLLFEELPKSTATPDSEIYLLRREVRGDGVVVRPVRITLEQAAEMTVNILDEGNAYTQYLPNAIYDEEDAVVVYADEEIINEGGA